METTSFATTDGTFAGNVFDVTKGALAMNLTGKLTAGNGVTAELLLAHGIPVFGESETEECLIYLKNRG